MSEGEMTLEERVAYFDAMNIKYTEHICKKCNALYGHAGDFKNEGICGDCSFEIMINGELL